MNPWILEDPKKDIFLILTPGFFIFALVYFANLPELYFQVIFFAVFALIDSGHVYTTLWRTYLNPKEWRTHKIYIYTPLVILGVIFAWYHFQIPYLWSFIFYATVYHHLRQYFGVLKWYEKLSSSYSPHSGKILYTLSSLPLIASHFRHDLKLTFYTKNDFINYPHQKLFWTFTVLHLALLLLWLLWELRLFQKSKFCLHRFLSILFPVSLYSLVAYFGKSTVHVMVPLIVAHGIPYISMMAISMKRSQKVRFPHYKKILTYLILTAIICGSLEYGFEVFGPNLDDHYLFLSPPLWESLLVGLYLIPVLSHYTLDAFIWRRKHREGGIIFSPEEA